MSDAIKVLSGRLKTWASVVALATAAGVTMMPAAHADESAAKALFKAMSDYLAAQKAISFDFDSNLESLPQMGRRSGWQAPAR